MPDEGHGSAGLTRFFPPGRRRAALVVTVVVLIAAAGLATYAYFAPRAAPGVSVTGFNWTFQEGTVATGPHAGIPWFGVTYLNDSGAVNGFPILVASGGSLTVSVYIDNWDNASHNITGFHLASPLLHVDRVVPSLPMELEAADDGTFEVTVSVQAPAGAMVFGVGSVAAT